MKVVLARSLLELLREVSKDTHPEKFTCYLRAEKVKDVEIETPDHGMEDDDIVITELVMTAENEVYRMFAVDALPRQSDIRGVAISHPSGELELEADDHEKLGGLAPLKIVLAEPYGPEDWTCHRGDEEGKLELVEVAPEEDNDISFSR
ncbi:MAG: hypothetical protein ABEK59_11280 [Halobacteria archaeon]